MKKIFKLGVAVLAGVVIVACGGDSGGGSTDDDNGGENMIPDPQAASLVFPQNNSLCNEGSILSDSQSTVNFQWNLSQNTDSYTVSIQNLDDNSIITRNSVSNSVEVTIQRSTPYEWFVTSRANGTNATAQSSVARFYNEGPGIESFAPFPATATNPSTGANLPAQTTTVDLSWTASDLDNDIVSYEVFIGTSVDVQNSLGSFTTNTTGSQSVSSGTTYYWSVKTLDQAGNISYSDLFSFRIL